MGLRAAGRRLLRGLPALAVLGVGCGVLVDGELDLVHCTAEGESGPPACPVGQVCEGGLCVRVELARRALGEPCDTNGDCSRFEFCLDPTLFGGEGPRVCSRSCCSSSDCNPRPDAVCWVPPEGTAGFCRVGRDVQRDDVGTRPAGEGCSGHGDCRSGICSDAGACVDACCPDADCAAPGTTCQLTTDLISSGSAWACQLAEPD